jgi:hypothetical protein
MSNLFEICQMVEVEGFLPGGRLKFRRSRAKFSSNPDENSGSRSAKRVEMALTAVYNPQEIRAFYAVRWALYGTGQRVAAVTGIVSEKPSHYLLFQNTRILVPGSTSGLNPNPLRPLHGAKAPARCPSALRRDATSRRRRDRGVKDGGGARWTRGLGRPAGVG